MNHLTSPTAQGQRRDFRRQPARPAHRGRRLLALAAAIAVPAMAAPAEWRSFALAGGEVLADAPQPMGFETPGESFPGSAFYYLADEPYRAVSAVEADRAETADPRPADALAGPAALPLASRGSATDKARALQCLTQAIYYEAASEPDAGQRAVAQVVLNRVAHPTYPNSVCGVVFQGSTRSTGCQFSFTCDGSLARQPSRPFWARAQRVALAALAGAVYRPVGLATHYHTVQIHPYWADSLQRVGTIGAHQFYRWNGAAGRPAAFRSAYAGNEPLPAAAPRKADGDAAALDPVELARRYEASLAREEAVAEARKPQVHGLAAQAPAKQPAPAYSQSLRDRGGEALFSGERLPQSSTVKPEYAQSGQWITRP